MFMMYRNFIHVQMDKQVNKKRVLKIRLIIIIYKGLYISWDFFKIIINYRI